MRSALRRRILIGYSIALVLVLGVLLLSFSVLLRLGRASDAILSENYRSIQAAEHMIAALERQDSGILLYMLGGSESGVRQFRESQSDFSQWLGRAKDNVTIAGEAEVLAEIDSAYADFLVAFTSLLRGEAAGRTENPASLYAERVLPLFLPVRDAAARLRDMNERTMAAASARAHAVARRSIWLLAIVGGLMIVAGLGFSLILSNRLVKPIRELAGATSRLAGGDYDVRVPESSRDELGDLGRRFNEMASQLKAYRDLNVDQLMAEKRKSEALVRSIDDGLLVADREFRMVDANRSALRIFGADREKLQGQHLLEVIKDETLFEKVRATLESGGSAERGEPPTLYATSVSGEARHFDVSVRPLPGESREAFGVVLIFRDVTQLKEIDRLKSEFVATVSHELRTPLTSIAMSLDLLEEHAGNRLQSTDFELLEGTRKDIERLRALVRDLLDLSRLEAGRIELDIQEVEPSLVCEKAVEAMRAQAERDGIQLVLRLESPLSRIQADVNKVAWVVTNLIANALNYAAAGQRVEVSARQMGSSVHVSVRDYGPGIPYESQSRIFDKFVQLDGTSERGGTGLGLAICREVVRAHGGSIWVESVPGDGSTFTFTLPVARQLSMSR